MTINQSEKVDGGVQLSMFKGETLELRPELIQGRNIIHKCPAQEVRGGGSFLEIIRNQYVKREQNPEKGMVQYIQPQGVRIYVQGRVSEDETQHIWKADDRFGAENISNWNNFIGAKEA